MALYKILAIDGGGIRGVIPALLLTEIEKLAEKPISDLFDLIAGTSAGGILAVGFATPKEEGRGSGSPSPKFKASELLALYEERGKDIFVRSFWDGVTSLGGLTDEKYSSDGIESVLKDYLGDLQLKDALTEILVTSYDIENRQPYFFKRSKAIHKDTSALRNHLLRQVARATSAAPTYFEPAEVLPVGRPGAEARHLIDGGVFANNPALCAYAEAISLGISPDDLLLVSLGTGIATRPIKYDEAKDWGKVGWIQPVLSVMMDGVADAVDYQLRKMLPTEGLDARYFRFDIHLREALDDLDAAHQANIAALKREAHRILNDPIMGPQFEAVIKVLRGHPSDAKT